MFKKIKDWLHEYNQKQREKENMRYVNRTIYIRDVTIDDSQAIALVVDGVVIDYTFGNGKPSYDPDGAILGDDAGRLIGKLLNMRVMELDRIKKGGKA